MDRQEILVEEVTMVATDLEAEVILDVQVADSTEGEEEDFIKDEVTGEDINFMYNRAYKLPLQVADEF